MKKYAFMLVMFLSSFTSAVFASCPIDMPVDQLVECIIAESSDCDDI